MTTLYRSDFIPIRDFFFTELNLLPTYEGFHICDGCGILTGDAYSCGYLVPSHLGPVYVLLVETNPLSELVAFFLDFSLRTFLGTLSILIYESRFGNCGFDNTFLFLMFDFDGMTFRKEA